MTTAMSLMDEIEATLARGFDYVEVLASDLPGNLFGKRYPIHYLTQFGREGLRVPRSMFVLTNTGEDISKYTGMGGEDGDPDIPVELVPGSLGSVSWSGRPRAQALITSAADEDVPDPRRILKRVLRHYGEAGLTPVVAFELEFNLFDGKRKPDGRIAEARNPKTGARDRQGMLSLDRLDGFEAFLEDVTDNCDSQNIATTSVCSEFAAGQFEINFPHYEDALVAADKAQLFRRTVQAVARKHGFIGTFMAKPELSRPGNGQHIHVSVLGKDGKNIFNGGEQPAAALMHAVAGLQTGAAEAMLYWAPNMNSFRRFEPENCTPTGPTWAFEHRHVAFRIPLAKGEGWRVENRIPGADANCYLALAAMLASMLVGIKGQLKPSDETVGAPDMDRENLPLRLRASVEAAREGSVLKPFLGEDFITLMANMREGEQAHFEDYIGPRELDWYL